jgi:hypothetical protein
MVDPKLPPGYVFFDPSLAWGVRPDCKIFDCNLQKWESPNGLTLGEVATAIRFGARFCRPSLVVEVTAPVQQEEWPPKFEGWEFVGWANFMNDLDLHAICSTGEVSSVAFRGYAPNIRAAYIAARGPLYRKVTP